MAVGDVVATGVAAIAGAVTSLATSGVVDAAGVLVLVGGEGEAVDGVTSGAATVAGVEVAEGVDGVVVAAAADGGEEGLAADGGVAVTGAVADGVLGNVAAGAWLVAGCALSCASATAMPASSEAIAKPASLETFENVGRR